MSERRETNKKAKRRWVKKPERDPAWVYMVLGVVCLSFTVLYALRGNHHPRLRSARSGDRATLMPAEVYIVTITSGVGLIVVGIRKAMASPKGPEQD